MPRKLPFPEAREVPKHGSYGVCHIPGGDHCQPETGIPDPQATGMVVAISLRLAIWR